MCLRDFLTGKDNKAISAFKLDELNGYGIYSEKPPYYVVKFLGALFDYEIIDRVKDEQKRENIELKNDSPSDETIIDIFNALKWK